MVMSLHVNTDGSAYQLGLLHIGPLRKTTKLVLLMLVFEQLICWVYPVPAVLSSCGILMYFAHFRCILYLAILLEETCQ